MDVCFDCAQCGRCCHDLRLTLSLGEARVWAGRGHRVDLLAEAWPWPHADGEHGRDYNDPVMQWRHDTSFAVLMGDVPFRANIRLVAHHKGACPHLLPDMRCGNYAERPRICRIYPLESRPFEAMSPARRLCPPEAWQEGLPVLERAGEPADPQAQTIIAAHRSAMVADVPAKARLCGMLGIAETAFAGEGLAAAEIAPTKLANAIDAALSGEGGCFGQWSIVTNREPTRAMLAGLGCPARLVPQGPGFLSSFADSA
jgi:Fe-S-cluster containining protein